MLPNLLPLTLSFVRKWGAGADAAQKPVAGGESVSDPLGLVCCCCWPHRKTCITVEAAGEPDAADLRILINRSISRVTLIHSWFTRLRTGEREPLKQVVESQETTTNPPPPPTNPQHLPYCKPKHTIYTYRLLNRQSNTILFIWLVLLNSCVVLATGMVVQYIQTTRVNIKSVVRTFTVVIAVYPKKCYTLLVHVISFLV